MQTLNPSYNAYINPNKNGETLNSSWASSKNVDCSDIVLKGDVKLTLKRNASAVDSSMKTLNINESINQNMLGSQQMYNIQNIIQSNVQTHAQNAARQSNWGSQNRYNYHNEQDDTFKQADSFSNKQSPDLKKHLQIENYYQKEMDIQKNKIKTLENQLQEMREKLKFYEDNWKCSQKPTMVNKEVEVNIAIPSVNRSKSDTADFWNQSDREVGDRSVEMIPKELWNTEKGKPIFIMSPDNYDFDLNQNSNKNYIKYDNEIWVTPNNFGNISSVPLDQSNNFEQHGSNYQQNDKNGNQNDIDFDFTLSNVDLKHIKETPIQKVNKNITSKVEKSPNYLNESNHSDSFMQFKMIIPNDKSKFAFDF